MTKMIKRTKPYEYCHNCSNRVEVLESDIPGEVVTRCETCQITTTTEIES